MTTTLYNRKAGTCILRVTDRSRVLEHQCEADSDLAAVRSAIREAVTRLVEAHKLATLASVQLVAANRLVGSAAFVPPTCPDCYGSGVLDGELCTTCKARSAA